MKLIIQGREAVIPEDTTIRIIYENILLSHAGSYSLDISLSLKDNRQIFGFPDEGGIFIKRYDSCSILEAGFTLAEGHIDIMDIKDNMISCQLVVTGQGITKYYEKEDTFKSIGYDIKPETIPYDEVTGHHTGSAPLEYWHNPGADEAKYLNRSWPTHTMCYPAISGTVQLNKFWERALVYNFVACPFVGAAISEIAKAKGLRFVPGTLGARNNFANLICLRTSNPSGRYDQFFEDLKILNLLYAIESYFDVRFVIRDKTLTTIDATIPNDIKEIKSNAILKKITINTTDKDDNTLYNRINKATTGDKYDDINEIIKKYTNRGAIDFQRPGDLNLLTKELIHDDSLDLHAVIINIDKRNIIRVVNRFHVDDIDEQDTYDIPIQPAKTEYTISNNEIMAVSRIEYTPYQVRQRGTEYNIHDIIDKGIQKDKQNVITLAYYSPTKTKNGKINNNSYNDNITASIATGIELQGSLVPSRRIQLIKFDYKTTIELRVRSFAIENDTIACKIEGIIYLIKDIERTFRTGGQDDYCIVRAYPQQFQ